MLNFSIAYGKTAHGLAKDFGVSTKEAEETVQLWYSDRPEVRAWQEVQHRKAAEKGKVSTLLGRHRNLPEASSSDESAAATRACARPSTRPSRAARRTSRCWR